MYPLGSLTGELQNATRKLLDVFESPDSKATQGKITQGTGKGLGSIGRLTQMKSPNGDSSINCDCNPGARNNSSCRISLGYCSH